MERIDAQVLERCDDIGMIRGQCAFPYRERAPVLALGVGKSALDVVGDPEIVEDLGNVGVVGWQDFFADCQRTPVHRLGVTEAAKLLDQIAQIDETCGNLRLVLARVAVIGGQLKIVSWASVEYDRTGDVPGSVEFLKRSALPTLSR